MSPINIYSVRNIECELCSCMDYYVIRDAGTLIEQNPKAVFWIGYKY
jgi:hypothetical protein